MMALELAGGSAAVEKFLSKLQLMTYAPSPGGVDTLVSEPRYTSHAHVPPLQLAMMGITDSFLRISVGIEDVADLIADLEQALR
jgi:cystathionine beta-lyase/cystathionine gamma-synthase